MSTELTQALYELKRAIEFMDKVQAATLDEKIAVGRDHWDWLKSASRKVVETTPEWVQDQM